MAKRQEKGRGWPLKVCVTFNLSPSSPEAYSSKKMRFVYRSQKIGFVVFRFSAARLLPVYRRGLLGLGLIRFRNDRGALNHPAIFAGNILVNKDAVRLTL